MRNLPNTPSNVNRSFGRYNTLLDNAHRIDEPTHPILEGVVQAVNTEDQTCLVYTEDGRSFDGVPCATPWFSFSSGKGIYAHPEANSRVLLTKAFSGSWYIIGFIPLASDDENAPYANNKELLNEGDIYLSTKFGNYLSLLKDAGCIDICNSHACRILMDSMANRIFMYSQQLKVVNSAAKVEMFTNEDGDTATTAFFRYKLDNILNFIKVILGNVALANANDSVGDKNPETLFSFNVSNKAGITVDFEGNVKVYLKSLQIFAEEGLSTHSGGPVDIKCNDSISVNATGLLKLLAGDINVGAGDNVSVASNGALSVSAQANMSLQAGGNMVRGASGNIIDTGGSITHSRGTGSPQSAETYSAEELPGMHNKTSEENIEYGDFS